MTSQAQQKKANETEIEVWRNAFGMFDKNGDGTISLDELEKVLHSLNLNPTKKEVKEAAKRLDKDDNGKCDFNDFVIFMQDTAKNSKDYEKEMKAAFKVFDQDGNNFIDKHELVYILCSLGETLTECELDLAMKYLDIDGDGRINYEEFVKLCNSPLL